MQYDDVGNHSGPNYAEGVLNESDYMNGEQPSNDASNYYEPPAAESTRHGNANPPVRPPKKSKSKKKEDTYYDPPVAHQTDYDAPASQHNYYAPPNDANNVQVNDEMDADADAEAEVPPPPRTTSMVDPNSKSKSKQKPKKSSSSASGSGSGFLASLRRSFSKKKKKEPEAKEIAIEPAHKSEAMAEPQLPNAFVHEQVPPENNLHSSYNDDRNGNENAIVHDNDNSQNISPNRATFVEPVKVTMRDKKQSKKEAELARMASLSRLSSVENLRGARQKLIDAYAPPAMNYNMARARVILLDGEEVTFMIEKWVNADVLFAKVCDRVNVDVVDQDFFGLTYIQELQLPDPSDESKKKLIEQKVWFWLDSSMPIYKQQRDFSKWEFRFQVKFYPPEPTAMREDLSRYQLCLQLRQDLYYGKLPCAWVVHALLGSYTVQSELGDYEDVTEMHANDMQSEAFDNQSQVPPGVRYIQNFAFLPNQQVDLLERIVELHRTHKGLTPAEADYRFLENVKRLPLYGVDLHSVLDANGTEIQLGVSYYGIVVYRNGLLLNKFSWPKIVKVAFKRYKFYVCPRADAIQPQSDEIEFQLADKRLAKRLWTIAVEHHTFWRLKSPDVLNKKYNNFARKTMSMLSLSNSSATSTFRFSGRTLFEQRKLKEDAEQNDTGRDSKSVKFDRLASKRVSASMPHLNNSGRAGSMQLSSAPNRMKAAQSLTSLMLPPPRLGSLRDVTGGSTRSLRGQTLPAQAMQPAPDPAPPAPVRTKSRKPPPAPPPAASENTQDQITAQHVVASEQAPSRSSDYSEPSKLKKKPSKKDSKHEKKDSSSSKKKKKAGSVSEYAPVGLTEPEYTNGPERDDQGPELESEPEQEPVIPAVSLEPHPTLLSNDDGYEHLEVASAIPPSQAGDTDSMRRPRSKNKMKVTFSDSETEIDRIPANFGDHLSTLDSDTTSYGYSNTPQSNANQGGVTDLDHSAVEADAEGNGHATASLQLGQALNANPTYSNVIKPANGKMPNGSQRSSVEKPNVGETNLDDDEPHALPPLPKSLPPEPHSYGDDDGDTL